MAEISTLRAGSRGEFRVEAMVGRNGEVFGPETLAHEKILVVAEGMISLQRSDDEQEQLHTAVESIHIPAGITHRVKVHATPTKLVTILPDTGE